MFAGWNARQDVYVSPRGVGVYGPSDLEIAKRAVQIAYGHTDHPIREYVADPRALVTAGTWTQVGPKEWQVTV